VLRFIDANSAAPVRATPPRRSRPRIVSG
jgi:hypothetical protein